MRMMLIVPAAALALAACGSEPKPVSETSGNTSASGSVTYKYDGDQIKDASEKAAAYCSKSGRQAQLRTVNKQSGENLATFDCK